MNLDRTTLSPRRVAVAVLLAFLAVTAIGVLALAGPETGADATLAEGGPGDGPPSDAPRASATPRRSAGSAPTAVPSPTGSPAPLGDDPASGLPPVGEVDPALEEELVQARQQAADFAVGILTYRYDDTPATVLGRVRPFATEELAVTLSQQQGGVAAREEMAAREEQAVAQVQTVEVQGATATEADILVVVRQSVITTGGTTTENPAVLVRMARRPEGWVAEGFTP